MDRKPSEQYYETLEKPHNRPRGCCCCCRTRRSKIVCGTILLLILIGLTVGLYFCVPRGKPEVQFNGVETTGSVDLTKLVLDVPKGIAIPLALKLNVYNPNLIGIKVNNITVKGFYQTPDGHSVQIGDGALSRAVTFPAKGHLDFQLPITLVYNIADDQNVAIALNAFLNHCGITTPQKTPIPMRYQAVLEIPLISWLGIRPEVENEVHFDCPINVPTSVSSTVGSILGGILGNLR
ncbi:hypothetical protein K493DRAFT_373649 [Basidiobolus meristosporus CBS 931.73]|uniref:Late embryogenesis abundant protein LEA-2 subgroup domain-containing protein n=1 Tax=Basidiobolus meristosporus CBS 931.73 TaxID=1314790 RepID=A0A1Y1Y8Y6_9FUNG|nr:hypothetical protein K493DRAFT_373649 [Basidiobolus meristosporus CBS 931.73]|eukprot:ORX94481.1 hypothetical protein K493DRAFT_373649 [Basidiobolus meristosporus CBS 931.73]